MSIFMPNNVRNILENETEEYYNDQLEQLKKHHEEYREKIIKQMGEQLDKYEKGSDSYNIYKKAMDNSIKNEDELYEKRKEAMEERKDKLLGR